MSTELSQSNTFTHKETLQIHLLIQNILYNNCTHNINSTIYFYNITSHQLYYSNCLLLGKSKKLEKKLFCPVWSYTIQLLDGSGLFYFILYILFFARQNTCPVITCTCRIPLPPYRKCLFLRFPLMIAAPRFLTLRRPWFAITIRRKLFVIRF